MVFRFLSFFLCILLVSYEGGIVFASYVCMSDLDQSGAIDQPNEMANCVFNYYCPDPSQSCDQNGKCIMYFAPDCPSGRLDGTRDKCISEPVDLNRVNIQFLTGCQSPKIFYEETGGLLRIHLQMFVQNIEGSSSISIYFPSGYTAAIQSGTIKWCTFTYGNFGCLDDDGFVYAYINAQRAGGSSYGDCDNCQFNQTLNIRFFHDGWNTIEVKHAALGITSSGCRPVDIVIDLGRCPQGMDFSLSDNRCEAVPICENGTYDPQLDKCKLVADCRGQWDCPLPGGGQCADLNLDDTWEADQQFESTNASNMYYYDNDGQRDSQGNCLDQIYIFNGQPQECLTSGVKTGFHNCCDECDSSVRDDMKSAFSQVGTLIQGASTMWKYTKIAWKAYQAWNILNTSGGGVFSLATKPFDLFYDKTQGKWQIGSELACAIGLGGCASPASAADAIKNALSAAFPSPQGILMRLAINFVLNQALSIFFGGCDANSVLTACYVDLGLCHYVGSYCKKKWALVGCVQKAKVYCCFNSKLARIVHEQGRPQLKTFNGPNGGWGTTPDDDPGPICRGFTPEEFQMLDFSRIDLSEWYGDIQHRVETEIRQKFQQNVQQFQQNIR